MGNKIAVAGVTVPHRRSVAAAARPRGKMLQPRREQLPGPRTPATHQVPVVQQAWAHHGRAQSWGDARACSLRRPESRPAWVAAGRTANSGVVEHHEDGRCRAGQRWASRNSLCGKKGGGATMVVQNQVPPTRPRRHLRRTHGQIHASPHPTRLAWHGCAKRRRQHDGRARNVERGHPAVPTAARTPGRVTTPAMAFPATTPTASASSASCRGLGGGRREG